MNSSNSPILVIVGPTGTGKTALALSVLQKIRGEIISGDSRQIYKYLDYSTNKLDVAAETKVEKYSEYWIQDGVRINMYDVLDLSDTISAGVFTEKALSQLERIGGEALPVVVGGSGFYIDSLLGLSPISAVGPNHKLRMELGVLSLDDLQNRLLTVDPVGYEQLNDSDRQNVQRLTRFIEVVLEAGSIENGVYYSPLRDQKRDVLFVGLTSSRENLYAKADAWTERLFNSREFLAEMELLVAAENVSSVLANGAIIKEGILYVRGDLPLSDAIQATKYRLHHYIKRQMVWFKRNPKINWFDVGVEGWQAQALAEVARWYDDYRNCHAKD